MSQAMNGGVIAAPTPPPAKGTLVAKPRSLIAIHAAMVRLKLGHAAASPMPTQNRTKPSESTTGKTREIAHPRRCGGRERPPQRGKRQDFARTELVGQPAAGNLKQPIRKDERAEDFAHLDVIERGIPS